MTGARALPGDYFCMCQGSTKTGNSYYTLQLSLRKKKKKDVKIDWKDKLLTLHSKRAFITSFFNIMAFWKVWILWVYFSLGSAHNPN